jgi:lipoprotein-anchoring transpeptidase ErfK/SrfK
MNNTGFVSRRNFLKLSSLGIGGILLRPAQAPSFLVDFPQSERLGRVCVGKIDLKLRPDQDSQSVGVLYEDAVLPWIREVVGRRPYYINQRWVETPEGYIYGPYLQPVRNFPNDPIDNLKDTSLGQGIWAEVTVPYADVILENKPSTNSWVEALVDQGLPVRIYFGQVFWVDRIRVTESGRILYRINPNYYGGVDLLWVEAQSLRPITPQDIEPISPEAEQKRIVVDVIQQSLSCYEGEREVFYCRVSTGAKFDAFGNPVDKWATPLGKHRVSRKYISLQMSGGTTGASYDLPGIGWTTIFVTGGVAIHATFWHNDFGVPRSHGCVNVLPEHAKWIFRWTAPVVHYDTGAADISFTNTASTAIDVVEG